MRPASGWASRAIMRSSVDFPHPEGPSTRKKFARIDAQIHSSDHRERFVQCAFENAPHAFET